MSELLRLMHPLFVRDSLREPAKEKDDLRQMSTTAKFSRASCPVTVLVYYANGHGLDQMGTAITQMSGAFNKILDELNSAVSRRLSMLTSTDCALLVY